MKIKIKSILALLLLFLVIVTNVQAQPYVTDGDTIKMDGVTYRLWGIDAPEKGQECIKEGVPYLCGIDSKNALVDFLAGKEISCEKVSSDRYGRTVAKCFADGEDMAAYLVGAGHALDYSRYSKGYYYEYQKAAKEQGLGVWSGQFQEPWKWRRKR